ncbi:hypothetical protein ACQ4PT_019292 [Festuca glaucescens]
MILLLSHNQLGLDGTSLGSSSESRKGTLSEQVLSRLHMSVVALASFHGDTLLRECTGICIDTSCPGVTSFLTSIDLVPHTWPRKKIFWKLSVPFIIDDDSVSLCSFEIKVRLPDDKIVTGRIQNPDIYHDFFVVDIAKVSGFAPASLDRDMKFEPYRKVAAVWRHFDSGSLEYRYRSDLSSPIAPTFDPLLSTCMIHKRPSILRFLWIHKMIKVDDATRARIKYDMEEPCLNMIMTGGKRIKNGLEQTFDKDMFIKPFKGCAKKFACTGVFIECNARSATILTSASLLRVSGEPHRIEDNLRIEVCLPDDFRVVGVLNHYNLRYNIALVEIMGYWGVRAIKISGHQVTSSMNVIAVGSIFAHHKLMATEGEVLIGKKSKLDCVELCVSTCKITKAGIGGPLIDTHGEFVGMNFYHEEETPFLSRDVIHRLLLNLNKGRTSEDVQGDENRWLLPGETHRNTAIAEGGGNKWPLPKRPRVCLSDMLPNDSFYY